MSQGVGLEGPENSFLNSVEYSGVSCLHCSKCFMSLLGVVWPLCSPLLLPGLLPQWVPCSHSWLDAEELPLEALLASASASAPLLGPARPPRCLDSLPSSGAPAPALGDVLGTRRPMTTFLHPARQLWPCPCRLSAARLLCTSEKLFLINRDVCCWTGSPGLFWLWTEQDQAV